MAQGIRPLNMMQASYAEEALPAANMKRGNMAMNLPNPGVRNAMDGGDASKVNMNPQVQINQGLGMQNMQQNLQTSNFQNIAGAMGQNRAAMSQMTDAESKAQIAMNNQIANVMMDPGLMPGGAPGMAKFAAISNDPAAGKRLLNDMAINSAMYQKSMMG